jgi:hypothetical protein
MGDKYDKSGDAGRKGTDYEIRLLLHFLVRALVNGYQSFQLACNMKAAGKFDDVVFRYRRNEGEPERLRLIQAKNTGNAPITVNDLVKNDQQISFKTWKALKVIVVISTTIVPPLS